MWTDTGALQPWAQMRNAHAAPICMEWTSNMGHLLLILKCNHHVPAVFKEALAMKCLCACCVMRPKGIPGGWESRVFTGWLAPQRPTSYSWRPVQNVKFSTSSFDVPALFYR